MDAAFWIQLHMVMFGSGLTWVFAQGPERTAAFRRGWSLAATSVLRGLWRSVRPFASSAPVLGPPRPSQGSWGSLRSRRAELLTEAAELERINLDALRLINEVEHRIHDVTTNPLVRKVSCPNCLEPVAEIAMPHTACPAELVVPKHQIGYRSLNIPCPWE